MDPAAKSDARFAPTSWSAIVTAAGGDQPEAGVALEQLCQKYWYPIYAFLRRQGRSPHDAEDLTQEFFEDLLGRDWLRKVAPEKGRFRTFLLACLRNFLSHIHERDAGPSRHPGQPILSIDAGEAEARYAIEPADVSDPAALFDRRWAYALVNTALCQLRQQYVADDKGLVFDALCEFLAGRAEHHSYPDVAMKLHLTEGAVRVAVSRLRGRFRELLCAEVLRTVQDARDGEGEIRDLLRVAQRS